MKTLLDIYSEINKSSDINKTYISFDKKVLTYGILAQRLRQITTLYSHHEMKKGDRVIICSDNDEAVILFTISALLNGLTSIILSPDTKPSRAQILINKTNSNLAVSDASKLAQWNIDSGNNSFTIKETKANKSSLLAKFKRIQNQENWLNDLDNFEDSEPSLLANPEQIAFINFTSGTTAEPKGVQLSYFSLFSHLETLGKQFTYSDQSRILNNMMLAHVDGMFQGPVLALYYNASLYRPCNMDLQHIEYFLNTIHREGISHVLTVPTILSFIDKYTDHDDYFQERNFKCLISVAGMLRNDLWERLEHRFKIRICNLYGLTETVTGGVFCGPDDETYRKGTVGKPIDMQLKIINSNNQQVVPNEQGELWLKGNNVFSGYLEDKAATSKVIQDEWFRTGDIAFKDKDGFIHICGRLKELIVSGGFNIHPAEVNEALMKHEEIIDVATIGQPNQDWDEIVVSVVVRKPGSDISELELINASREWLESRKVPKQILFVDEIPRGDSGKVQIPQLQNILTQQQTESQQDFTLENFFSLVAKELYVSREQLSLASRAGEVPGWDSMGHLSLILAVEKAANISLNANNIMSIVSLNDLWDIIQNK